MKQVYRFGLFIILIDFLTSYNGQTKSDNQGQRKFFSELKFMIIIFAILLTLNFSSIFNRHLTINKGRQNI